MFSLGRLTNDPGATRKGNSETESKVGMKLEFFPEGTASEETYGFSRVVKVGELIHVAGTTSGSAGLEGPSAYEQAVEG